MFNLFSSFSIIVVGLVLFISLLLKFIEHIEIITIPSLAQKLLKTTIKIASVYLVIATLIIVFWPKNDRQIRKIISNQVRVETEKAKEALTVLEKKSKNGLSLKEIIEAKNLKKQIEKTEEYYKSDDFEEKGVALKPAPAKPARWIFQIQADPEVIIRARAKRVNQAPLTEFNLNYFSKTDNELRFRYKTPTGKTVDVLLNKRSLNDSHYFGMADLPDPPKGRKMMLWLKNDGDDGFEGTTVTWDGSRWYPTVTAFLKRTS